MKILALALETWFCTNIFKYRLLNTKFGQNIYFIIFLISIAEK